MKTLLYLFCFLITATMLAQITVNGTVIDENKEPLLGVNVFIKGSYDGATTDLSGAFSFKVQSIDNALLMISYIGYEELEMALTREMASNLMIQLRPNLNALTTVVLSAGTFSAGDDSKTTVLKPLDVVTTAGAAGDFIGALQTLPGTSSNPDDGRLFVRGGSATETQIFIDGARVFRPFTPTTGNIPTRGRFSPMLFDGISFSTGGYSAEYGDALSAALLLETTDFPKTEKTEVQIMTVGAGAGNTQIWENNSLSINASYINLAPYNEIIPQNNRFIDPFQSASGEAVYRLKTSNGLFKAYGAFSYSDLSLQQQDINVENGTFFSLANTNLYGNLNYGHKLANSWTNETSLSLAYDTNSITIENTEIKTREYASHLKTRFNKFYSNYFKLDIGIEQFAINYDQDVGALNGDFSNDLTTYQTAAYSEAEVFTSSKLAFKVGARLDYYTASVDLKFSPRLSSAFSLNDYAQVSLAYGTFYQQLGNDILTFNDNLNVEKAQHFILNYQYKKNKRLLRLEAYHKDYDDLLTFNTSAPAFNSDFKNAGTGYATGVDVFWRDEKSIKNLEYWASYSYLDTKRQFRNFSESATPNFATQHNLNLVTKYWINSLKSQLGITYNYASGRPFTNANSGTLLDDKTPAFHRLDMNWAYLLDEKKILFLSVSNVLGRDNIFNYQYSNTPDAMGNFNRRAIGQAADRFIFLGFFWTIDGNGNQLGNL